MRQARLAFTHHTSMRDESMAASLDRVGDELQRIKRRNRVIIVCVFVALTTIYALIANNALILERQSIFDRYQAMFE